MYYVIYTALTSTRPCAFGGMTFFLSQSHTQEEAHMTAPEGCTFQTKQLCVLSVMSEHSDGGKPSTEI